jgi:hypothetical protein
VTPSVTGTVEGGSGVFGFRGTGARETAYRRPMTQRKIEPIQAAENAIDPGVRIGHVHLRTADIDRVHHVALNYPTRAGLVAVFGDFDLDDLLAEPAP